MRVLGLGVMRTGGRSGRVRLSRWLSSIWPRGGPGKSERYRRSFFWVRGTPLLSVSGTATRSTFSIGSMSKLSPVACPIGCYRVSLTTHRPQSGDDSAVDTPIGSPRRQAPRSQRRATPAGRDTQLHRKLVPETAHARVRCPREFQATFQQR